MTRKRKGVMEKKAICTYCGLPEILTGDHAIPRALWVGESPDRPIKVKCCANCNYRSDEGLLKSFFAMMDERIARVRLRELTHIKGQGDARRFLSLVSSDKRRIYPDDQVTKVLKKMILGIRRYLLGEAWTFLPMESLALFSVRKIGDSYVTWQLPLEAGRDNQGFTIDPGFYGYFDVGAFENRFRDFYFSLKPDGLLMFKYGRTYNGNELILAGMAIAD